jgi:hypothetical protein
VEETLVALSITSEGNFASFASSRPVRWRNERDEVERGGFLTIEGGERRTVVSEWSGTVDDSMMERETVIRLTSIDLRGWRKNRT